MNRKSYLVLGLIIFTVLSILGFDLYILKFGKFWEKKETQVLIEGQLSKPQVVVSPKISISEPISQQAEKATQELLTRTLKHSYYPGVIQVKPVLSSESISNPPDNTFTNSFTTKEGVTIISLVHFNNATIAGRQLFLGIPNGMITSLDASTATTLANTYLNSPPSSFNCDTNQNAIQPIVMCENIDGNGENIRIRLAYPFGYLVSPPAK